MPAVPEDRMAPTMRTLVVLIPGRPPTPNNRPQNWQAAAGIADRWKDLAQHQAGLAMQKDNEAWPSWSLTKTREGVPVGGRRKHPLLELWQASNPMLYAVRYEMAFIVADHQDRDWDNAVASSKPLTDGLVASGLLAGDSTRYINSLGRIVSFVYRRGVNAVQITIEEGEPPTEQIPLLTE